MTNYWLNEGTATMTNTGKTGNFYSTVNVINTYEFFVTNIFFYVERNENPSVSVSIEFSDRTLPTMRGGPLGKDEFQFMNVQFRWGPDNSLGAEHSINGIWLENFLF